MAVIPKTIHIQKGDYDSVFAFSLPSQISFCLLKVLSNAGSL